MTNGLKAQIEMTADATGVQTGVNKAKRSLADLGVSAQKAGEKASDGLAKVGDGGEKASAKVDRATKQIISSIERTTARLEAGSRSSSDYFKVLAEQRGVSADKLKPYLDQLEAVSAKTREAQAVLKPVPAQIDKIGVSARQTAAALRGVPAQFTDIITSLQGGQAPLTVFLQQGGQLKDMFGGAGAAARGLGGYVLGLVNPFTVAAAAVGVLTYANIKAAQESTEFAKAIVLSGNVAGVTVGQLQAVTASVTRMTGAHGDALEAVTSLAREGRVANSALQGYAAAAVTFQKNTGQAIGETAKQYGELAKAPLEASLKLNESLRQLTPTTYAQIKAMEELGDRSGAAAVAQRAYYEAQVEANRRIEESLGTIERAWRGVKRAIGETGAALVSLGRQATTQQLVDADRAALASLDAEASRPKPRAGTMRMQRSTEAIEADRAALRERIAAGEELLRIEQRAASIKAGEVARTEALIRFDKITEKSLSEQAKLQRDIAEARTLGALAGKSTAEIERAVADIRAKANKGGDKSALGIDKAELSQDLASIQSASQALLSIAANRERVLDALRSAGLVSEADYFAKKREMVSFQSAVEEAALEQQIRRLQAETKLTGADAINNRREVIKLEAALARVRDDSATKAQTQGIAEAAMARQRIASMLALRQAAEESFAAQQRAQEREASGFGSGRDARDLNAARSQIEDRYEQQRREIANQRALIETIEGKITDDQQRQFEQRLSIVAEFQAKSLASYEDYYRRRQELEASATLGFKDALQNYFDEAQKLGKQTEALTTKALTGIEDAFVDLAIKGKASFKDLAESIAADIARIAIRQQLSNIAKSLADAASTAQGNSIYQQEMGGGSSSANYAGWISAIAGLFGGRAIGGPVSRGGLYEINERGGPGEILESNGRQYLLAGQDGEVKPSSSGTSQPKIEVTNHFTLATPASRQTQNQVAAAAYQGVQRGLRNL